MYKRQTYGNALNASTTMTDVYHGQGFYMNGSSGSIRHYEASGALMALPAVDFLDDAARQIRFSFSPDFNGDAFEATFDNVRVRHYVPSEKFISVTTSACEDELGVHLCLCDALTAPFPAHCP